MRRMCFRVSICGHMHKKERVCASPEFLFCSKTIYNLAIEIFMGLYRLSLDATGHVQEASVFMAPFPDFSSDFFLPHSELKRCNPTTFSLLACLFCVFFRKPEWDMLSSKKRFHRLIAVTLGCPTLVLVYRLYLNTKMLQYIRKRHRREDMDYLDSFGKFISFKAILVWLVIPHLILIWAEKYILLEKPTLKIYMWISDSFPLFRNGLSKLNKKQNNITLKHWEYI